MKIDLKQPTNQKFVDWCKRNGANFVNITQEDSQCVWVIPETYGDVRLGVAFNEEVGTCLLGEGDDVENRFVHRAVGHLFNAEQVWLSEVLGKIAKYNTPTSTKPKATKTKKNKKKA